MAKVTGIGLGPGDAELITVKGLNRLRDSAVVAYPAPPDKPSFVRSIAATWLDDMARKIELRIEIPLDSAANTDHDAPYRKAADEILIQLDEDKNVAVLCEGDPLLYGSFIYLLEALTQRFEQTAARHEIEIVPGVSCVTAAAARMRQPLAIGNEPLLVLPALEIDDRLAEKLEQFPALAIVKIGRRFGALKQMLARLGLIDHACYIEYATLDAQEKTLPLRETDFTQAPYFSLILLRKPVDD